MLAPLLILIPIAVGVLLSAWLYGWPGSRQRAVARPGRYRFVLSLAAVVTTATAGMFFTREYWARELTPETSGRVFASLILLLLATTYAALVPQRNL